MFTDIETVFIEDRSLDNKTLAEDIKDEEYGSIIDAKKLFFVVEGKTPKLLVSIH